MRKRDGSDPGSRQGGPRRGPAVTSTADSLLGQPEVTLTLSKVDVLSAPALWEQVNMPIVTGSVMAIVVVPTWVQVVPSAEEYAVMVFPERVSLSQALGKL